LLIQLPEWLKTNFDLRRLHEGTIVDNSDPLFLGRVKATIPGLLEGEAEALPWIYPMTPTFLGGGQGSLMFFVPEMDSKIAVWFPAEDVCFGFYTGHFHTQATHDSTFEENYPESYGFKDSKGTYFLVNKTQGYMKIFHQSGSSVMIYSDGKMEIQGKADIAVSADGSLTIQTVGEISVKTEGAVAIEAATTVTVKAAAELVLQALGNISVEGLMVQLGGAAAIAGVITEQSYCPIRGTHVGAGSPIVKAV
jgi:hypothetical protein